MGSRNHEIVPTSLITHIAQLPSSIHKTIASLAKQNLIAKVQNAKCNCLDCLSIWEIDRLI
jgi:RIO kinase 2